MATIAEQLTSLANTKTAIKDAIIAKGVSVADTDTFSSYAEKIGEIPAGSATKYNITIDALLPTPDADGAISEISTPYDFVGTGIVSVGSFALRNRLSYTGCKTFYMPDLEEVGRYGMNYCVNYAQELTIVDMRKLRRTFGGYAMYYAFQNDSSITTLNLDNLLRIEGANDWASTFYGCTGLTKVYMPSLISIINSNGLGASSTGFLNRCTGVTEIHFPAWAQSTVESQAAYANKFGATNATIYFDLISMVEWNGNYLDRHEVGSVYEGFTKTFIAWLDSATGTVYYTRAGAEPTVGTPIYSDLGITEVGTAEYVE